MAALKNDKHEKFAQAIVMGRSADDAYVEAGYSFNRGNAARLKANESVLKRTEELRASMAEKAEWTALDRLASLKMLHDASLADDRRTAIAAISEANKMQGSYAPAKHQHTGANGGPVQIADITRLKGMTAEELKILERALVQIGLAEGDKNGTGEPEN